MKIYAVVREMYVNNISKEYLIERVFTSYKKAENYQRYINAWVKNNDLRPYVWKYIITEHEIETYNWKRIAIKEENKGSR